MKTLLVTLALGAAMISTEALAQDGGGERGGWAMQDQTRAQAQQRADMMFQRFDLNHDGTVTRQEAEQAASQFGAGGRAEKMIDRVFGDGAIADAAAVRGSVACAVSTATTSTMTEP